MAIALAGCGDAIDAKLVDLSDSETAALCEYANAVLPSTVVECMVDGMPVPIDPAFVRDNGCDDATAADIPATCPATVSDFKACAEAYAADLCVLTRGEPIAACAILESEACTQDLPASR